ncbi:MAG TPA: hypothetical protein VFW71_12785 [Actinomycetota bacterium]|nr:hypothetical protein [Actinomycetota bacterium]
MRVAVLGAASSRGLRVVRDFLERPDVSSVVIVGQDERDLARLLGPLDPRRVIAAPAVFTVEGIAGAIAGSNVAVACLEGNPEAEMTGAEAALSAGVPYVTACEDPDIVTAMLARRTTRPGGGSAVVAGMSWTPGLSNLLARAALERLEHVRSVRIAWCTSRNDEGSDGLERVLVGWSGVAEIMQDGTLTHHDPGAWAERVFFPEPVGWQRVHLVRGAEVHTLPQRYPGLDSLVVKGGMAGASTTALAHVVARASSGEPDPVRPLPGASGGVTRLKLGTLTRGIASGLGPFSARPTGWSSLRVDATGRSGGATRVTTFGVVDHLANLEAGPLVVAALQLGAGQVPGAGVLAPEAAFEPLAFLRELGERGVRVARLEH